MTVRVAIQRLPLGEGLPLPSYATAGAAGMDLASAEDGTLAPMERRLFATGFAIALPAGYEAQVRPRSGLAWRNGITLPNSPATIDSDYRGELKVALINLGTEPFRIERGMRIAQLVVAPVAQVAFEEQPTLPASERGKAGFGSTGLGAR
ncbi:MAG TPA: dUTP diphosphatase [Gemmatimonadales bacterium]|jgi:dUTP pyrophosphatase|nr:dUTP diphosphatase [Gemmatimonadales bacterium]